MSCLSFFFISLFFVLFLIYYASCYWCHGFVIVLVVCKNIVFFSLHIFRVVVKYHGKAAHASAFPWDGVNALDAAVLCYQNVSVLRQQLKPTWRVHGMDMFVQ